MSAPAIERLPGRRLLVVGDVILDRYVKGTVERISPEAPVPVVRVTGREHRPGGAANVAANVAALGAEPVLLAVTGDDDAANDLARVLGSAGIAAGGLLRVASRPTTVKTRVIAQHQQVVRLDDEDDGPVEAGALRELLERAREELPRVDAVIVSDYAKGLLVPPFLAEFLEAAHAARVPVVVDPKQRDFRVYQPCSVLTPNLGEAVRAADAEPRRGAAPDDIADRLLARVAVDALLITLGERGMLLAERGGARVSIAAEAREVFDVTGAGDTVVAVLATGLAGGLSLESAARLANAAAAVAVGRLGTAAVTLDELRAFIEHDRPA